MPGPTSTPQPGSAHTRRGAGRPAPDVARGASSSDGRQWSARASALTLAQVAASAGYVAWSAWGDAPEFSLAGYAFSFVLPAVVLALLAVAGLRDMSSARLALGQRVLTGVGTVSTSCVLAAALLILALALFTLPLEAIG